METYNDYTDYSSEIGWNLAIAYLKDNNKKDAKVMLEKLISSSEDSSAIHSKAKELLEKLATF
jgi:Tfp pilus assembly protein PilF